MKLLDKFNEVEPFNKTKDSLIQRKTSKQGSISVSTAIREDTAMKEEIPPLELSQIKPENIFDVLTAKNNIDIICIKAKNALDRKSVV